jgi:hypothetical protein
MRSSSISSDIEGGMKEFVEDGYSVKPNARRGVPIDTRCVTIFCKNSNDWKESPLWLLTVTFRFGPNVSWNIPRVLVAGAAFVALLLKVQLIWIVLIGTVIVIVFL